MIKNEQFALEMTSAVSTLARPCGSLRSHVSEIFGFDFPARLLITPGSLIALRLAFSSLRVRRLLFGEDEYYSYLHFPEIESEPDSGRPETDTESFTAKIESLVTWRGRYCAHPFNDSTAPGVLRVLDASHAGAAGFPRLENLNADIVIGNPGHWLGHGASKENLGFAYISNERLWKRLSATFRMFHLAVEGEETAFQSRWVDASLLERVSQWFSSSRIDHAQVERQHVANMALSKFLAKELGIVETQTALLWSTQHLSHDVLVPLQKAGLVWYPPDGGTRIMCRSDLLSSLK